MGVRGSKVIAHACVGCHASGRAPPTRVVGRQGVVEPVRASIGAVSSGRWMEDGFRSATLRERVKGRDTDSMPRRGRGSRVGGWGG